VVPPGAESSPMKFDLKVEEDKLAGTMAVTRNGNSRTSQRNLKKL